MLDMRTRLRGAAAAAGVLMIAFAASSSTADILNDWATVKTTCGARAQAGHARGFDHVCRVASVAADELYHTIAPAVRAAS